LSQVTLLPNVKNVGFSAAVNQAAKKASGDFLLLLNPDTLLSQTALSNMLALFERQPHLGAVGPVSNNAAGLQSAKHWLEDPSQAADPSQRDTVAAQLAKRFPHREAPTRLLTGFCFMIRRELFFRLGGLDSELILGFDDLDLCWRLSLEGLTFAVALDAFVYHAWHQSFSAGDPTEIEAMHQKSHTHFSQKLKAHYQRRNLIPSSMELWGIDWFTPFCQSKTAVCILVNPAMSGRNEACHFSIQQCRMFGLQDVLVVDTGNLGLSGAIDADFWSLRSGTTWMDLLVRLQRMFGPVRLLLLEAGLAIDPEMLGSDSLGQGPVANEIGGAHSSSPDRPNRFCLQSPVTNPPGRWLVLNLEKIPSIDFEIPWRSTWVARSMSWQPALSQAAERVMTNARTRGGPQLGAELPRQILEPLATCNRVGVMGKGQLLDLSNKALTLADCDGLIWRLDPLELPGLALLLRELRQAGMKRILFLFDNALYQAPGGQVAPRAIHPLDLRREVQQAGFRITDLQHWQDSPSVPYTPHYANTLSRIDAPLADEQLYATSSRLLLITEPCSTRLHLEPMVSIVLLALNQVEYTRKCIESLRTHCRQNYELILINNGSTDGTAAYFNSVPNAIVIHNEKNLGVAAGWNQGLVRASGNYVLILNNDTIPGPGFLENLVRCAENHPDAGIIVPRSNRIAGPQVIEDFQYQDETEIPSLAAQIQSENDLSCWEFPRLKGFCMLIPRPVLERIGPFDEQFGFGNFEDDDYSCRVRYSGYRLLVADDSFLFHFGSVSFRDAGVDWNRQMTENMGKFNRKWSAGRKQGLSVLEGNGILSCGSQPDLETAFKRIKEGRYAEAQSLFQTELEKSPANARAYYGLGMCLQSLHQPKDAFAMFCRSLELNPSQEDVGAATLDLLTREFDAESVSGVLAYLQRKYPVLNSLQSPQSFQVNVPSNWTAEVEDLISRQSYTDALAILLNVREHQGEDFPLCNLMGIVKYQQFALDEASHWFGKALQFNPCDSDALLNYYDSLLRLGISQKAIAPMEYALGMEPSLVDVRLALQEIKSCQKRGLQDADRIIYAREANIAAEHLIREGMLDKAKETLSTILAKQPDDYRALNNRGLLHWYVQEMGEAFQDFASSLEQNPWYIDALVNLYDCAFLSQRIQDFVPWLDRVEEANPGLREISQIRTEIRSGATPERLQIYFQKDAERAHLQEQIAVGQRLLDEGKLDSAVILFTDLLEDFPENIECLNAIGIAAFYRKQYEDAWKIFHHTLQLSPLDQDTLVNFWDACLKTGRQNAGQAVLQNALSVDPNLQAVAHILTELK
ncbi:MAG TPA: glycosyltransferase, partial [Fibrobacteraceae bacterium]|nr:glycosyltransferase [Fibrobacteraceae bacterium]